MVAFAVVAGLALLVLAIWRGSLTWRFIAARLALVRAARTHPAVTVERGLLFGPRLSIARGEHRITVVPMSLGFLRDDPPYTWWWITTTIDVSHRVSVHVCRRRESRRLPTIPSQYVFETGDPEFDARYGAYDFDPDEEEKANALTLLRDVEVKRATHEMLEGESDDCRLGSRMYVSRRRDGLDLGVLMAELQRVANLATAVEHAFTRKPYRG